MGLRVWIGIALLLAAARPALAEPKVESGPAERYDSACALAESIAGKLGYQQMPHDKAEQTCATLAPSMMGSGEKAEFLRCCTKHLETGASAAKPGTPKQQPEKKPKSI